MSEGREDAVINETWVRHRLLVRCRASVTTMTRDVTLRHSDRQGVFKGGIGLSRDEQEITSIISTYQ